MRFTLIIAVLIFSTLLAKAQPKADGKALYVKHCMTCHQVDGTGAQNMIPPLIKTEQVLGDKKVLINILLNGISGEIKVNGDMYAGEMPSQAILKDNEIAAVLTYVRHNFGNKASLITTTEVKKIRATLKK